MRTAFGMILCLVFIGCNNTESNDSRIFKFFENKVYKGDFVLSETLIKDLNGNETPDTIFLYKEREWNDPGDFQKIVIHFDSGTKMYFFNLGDWIGKPEFVKVTPEKGLLVIDGYTYASSPQLLTVIDLDENEPKIVFKDGFDLSELRDLNGDGNLEFIGRKYYAESITELDSIYYSTTYSPYFVMQYLDNQLIVNEELMEQYNLENYVGYFGKYDRHDRYMIASPLYKYGDLYEPYFMNMQGRLWPETSKRLLNVEELSGYSKEELRLMRNEIFAFHGYTFDSADLREYFETKEWYQPIGKEVIENLNKIEKSNIELILELERNN